VNDPVNYADMDGEIPVDVSNGWHEGPDGTKYRIDLREKPHPDMHIYHSDGETNVTHKGGWKQGSHRGKQLVPLPKKLRSAFRPIIKAFVKVAAKRIPVVGWVIIGSELYKTWRDPNSTWGDYGRAVLF